MSDVSPGRKAQRTAKWARTMTKWLITKYGKANVRCLVEFGGVTGAESYGIVDILAIRKNHKAPKDGGNRGDLFDIILVQTKGGSSRRPSDDAVDRMIKVKKHHRARAIVLGEWKKGQDLKLSELVGRRWKETIPADVFK